MAHELDDIDIVILTTKMKRCLTAELLHDFSFRTYVNQDWPVPPQEGWHHRAFDLEPKQLVCYRIFRGHQECLKMVQRDAILVLEDDAVPGPEWTKHLKEAAELLDSFEVVAVYGKALTWIKHRFSHGCRNYIVPDIHPSFGVKWTNGAVAYLARKEVALRISDARYEGLPFDIFLPEKNIFCSTAPECCIFEHSYNYGSHFHTTTPP